jgi:hypothetical protein
VASVVGWHFEIYMSIAGVVERELSLAGGDVRVYTPESFGYGFEDIVRDSGIYRGDTLRTDSFFRDLDSTTLYPSNEESPMIDMIVLGTCESE